MLAFSRAQADQFTDRPFKAATDLKSEDEIFIVPSSGDARPVQTHPNPIELVSNIKLHKIRKRFSLSNTVMNQIRSAYQSRSPHIQLPQGGDLSVELGVQHIEDEILNRLRSTYVNKSASLLPYFGTAQEAEEVNNHTLICGASGSGKSYYVFRELLLQPELADRPVYIFSPHAHNDPSILYLKKRKKKGTVLRLDFKSLVANKVQVNMSMFEPRSVVVFDDLEGLPRRSVGDYNLRSTLFGAASELFVQGRHKGIVAMCIAHNIFSAHEIKSIRQEAAQLVILARGSRATYERFLRQHLGFSKEQIKECWKMSGRSRWTLFHLSAPTYHCSQYHVKVF